MHFLNNPLYSGESQKMDFLFPFHAQSAVVHVTFYLKASDLLINILLKWKALGRFLCLCFKFQTSIYTITGNERGNLKQKHVFYPKEQP